MASPDQATSSMNESGTGQKIDTPLTQAGSRDVLAQTRSDLTAFRKAHGSDSAIGHTCSARQ